MEHIEEYDPTGGLDNRRRLTGRHEVIFSKNPSQVV